MTRPRRSPALKPSDDPVQLAAQAAEAVANQPSPADTQAYERWKTTYSEILTAYDDHLSRQADAELAAAQQKAASRRTFVRNLVIGVLVTVLAGSGAAWGISEIVQADQAYRAASDAVEADRQACYDRFYQQHHVKLVHRLADLLAEGEGGWIGPYSGQDGITGVTTSPSQLINGNGTGYIDADVYVSLPADDSFYDPRQIFLERRNGKLVLTLLWSDNRDMVILREDPRATHTSAKLPILVQAEKVPSTCFAPPYSDVN